MISKIKQIKQLKQYFFMVFIVVIMLFPKDSLNQEIVDVEYQELSYKTINTKEKECIVQVLWHETRGEPTKGIKDVMSVIYNRKQHPSYPSSYCSIIKQPYQFSYIQKVKNKQPIIKNLRDSEIYAKIDELATELVTDEFKSTLPKNVLWYAHHSVSNYWTKHLKKYKRTGEHNFYAINE